MRPSSQQEELSNMSFGEAGSLTGHSSSISLKGFMPPGEEPHPPSEAATHAGNPHKSHHFFLLSPKFRRNTSQISQPDGGLLPGSRPMSGNHVGGKLDFLDTEQPPTRFWDMFVVKACRERLRLLVSSLLFIVLVSTSFTAFSHLAKRTYQLDQLYHQTNNTANTNSSASKGRIEEFPAFLSYFCTVWLLPLYPLYFVVSIAMAHKHKSIIETVKAHVIFVSLEKSSMMKIVFRCGVLLVLWNIFLYCYLRGLSEILVFDGVTLFLFLPCCGYLFYWVLLHKKFAAIRVIAFIFAAGGIIVHVHMEQGQLWYKVLIATSVSSLALFTALLQRWYISTSMGNAAMFYSCLGLLNTLLTWPIFMMSSVLTSAEPISWGHINWQIVSGTAATLCGHIIAVELSNYFTVRSIRCLFYLVALPICSVVDLYWMRVDEQMTPMKVVSLTLLGTAVLMTAVPNAVFKRILAFVKSQHRKSAAAASNPRFSSQQYGNNAAFMQQPPTGNVSRNSRRESSITGLTPT